MRNLFEYWLTDNECDALAEASFSALTEWLIADDDRPAQFFDAIVWC